MDNDTTTRLSSTLSPRGGGVADDVPRCADWPGSQHFLLQVANVCYAAAFLVPHRLRLSVLLLRSVLALGFLFVTLWAVLEACALDIFVWNLAFLVTNGCHALYLAITCIPPRFGPELEDLFSRVFQPFKVNRRQYKELIRDIEFHELEAGDRFAEEGSTRMDEGLSILLSGRMKVTCQGVLLHYVNAWQFVDSPEWEMMTMDNDGVFQVTITALSRSRYAHWPRSRLLAVLSANSYLDFMMRQLVGRDVAHKLYSMAEVHRTPEDSPPAPLARSLSVDYVHTGSHGRVRSDLWRRRGSTADSLGASLGGGVSTPRRATPATLTVPEFPF